jgi:hypothetical protein
MNYELRKVGTPPGSFSFWTVVLINEVNNLIISSALLFKDEL